MVLVVNLHSFIVLASCKHYSLFTLSRNFRVQGHGVRFGPLSLWSWYLCPTSHIHLYDLPFLRTTKCLENSWSWWCVTLPSSGPLPHVTKFHYRIWNDYLRRVPKMVGPERPFRKTQTYRTRAEGTLGQGELINFSDDLLCADIGAVCCLFQIFWQRSFRSYWSNRIYISPRWSSKKQVYNQIRGWMS